MSEVPAQAPINTDIDLHVPAQRSELSRAPATVLLAVAIGGGLGALARYGILLLLPTTPGHFPLGTFLINVSGCLLIGVLMVLITEVWSAHPLARPFLGTGVLGGYTTFSTYSNEIRGLLHPGTVPLAFAYLALTVLCALLAVVAGMALARLATARVRAAAR